MYTISETILVISCTWTAIVLVMLLTFCNENKNKNCYESSGKSKKHGAKNKNGGIPPIGRKG